MYKDRRHYDSLIARIDRKEEFKQKSYTVFQEEIDNLL